MTKRLAYPIGRRPGLLDEAGSQNLSMRLRLYGKPFRLYFGRGTSMHDASAQLVATDSERFEVKPLLTHHRKCIVDQCVVRRVKERVRDEAVENLLRHIHLRPESSPLSRFTISIIGRPDVTGSKPLKHEILIVPVNLLEVIPVAIDVHPDV